MAQYLPGRINVVFRPGVTRELAIESLESAGVPDAASAEPFGQPGGSVRLQVRVEAGAEDAWITRIEVLEEVEICRRAQDITSPGRPLSM
jgi:hypothetical protein